MKKRKIVVLALGIGLWFSSHMIYGRSVTADRQQVIAMEAIMDRMEIDVDVKSLPEESRDGKGNTELIGDMDNEKSDQELLSDTPIIHWREITDFSSFKTQWKGLFVLATGDTLLELYHFDEKKVQNYVKALNQFAQKMLPEVQMYSLLVPTQVGLTDDQYRDYSDPQERAIAYAYGLLDSRYRKLEVFPSLYAHRDEYLYFRSDHHWTQRGAYYAAKVFVERAGFVMRDLAEYQVRVKNGFLGYLYGRNKSRDVAKNPDYIEFYTYDGENPKILSYHYKEGGGMITEGHLVVNTRGKAANYRAFLGGDFPLAVYRRDEGISGRNLMIVKDSYANAFVPWLTPYFDRIVLIDPRHYQGNIFQLVKQEKITDFLVLDYIMATELEGFIAMLNRLGNSKP